MPGATPIRANTNKAEVISVISRRMRFLRLSCDGVLYLSNGTDV
jgi:hypothetical protein